MIEDDLYHLRKAIAAVESTEATASDQKLAKAPQLELWLPVRNRFGALALLGQLMDHPMLGRDDIMTSPLVALNLHDGWARSCERLYRLGQPFFRLTNNPSSQHCHEPTLLMFEFPGMQPVHDLDMANRMIAAFVAHVRQRAGEVLESDPGRSGSK